MEKKSLRTAYGETLIELGGEMKNLVVLDADLASATMTKMFKKAYPDRFFDFGIAEANMVCEAVGMAHTGLVPFVSTFAIFGAGRAYEQIRNSVCYSKANVKLALSHAGLCVGEDGGSHQCLEDIALMRVLPNMIVVVPCDPIETAKATRAIARMEGPAYMRVARPVVECHTTQDTPFEIGKANVLRDGKDVAIIACGLMVGKALEAAKALEAKGVDAAVIDMHTIKPIDASCIEAYAAKCGKIITVEEHSVMGGLGSAVAEVVVRKGNAKMAIIGVQDKFGKSGAPDALFEEYGLTAAHIVEEYEKL